MDNKQVVEALNRLLSYEWAGSIQYLQHSFLVHGLWREAYKGFFESRAGECRDHAKALGTKIVALGGLPGVEIASIKQSRDVEEMLNQDLEFEKAALAAYHDALKLAKDDTALRHMLESMIEEETRGLEELEKCLSMKIIKMKDKEIKSRIS